jgi:hypothetical protein
MNFNKKHLFLSIALILVTTLLSSCIRTAIEDNISNITTTPLQKEISYDLNTNSGIKVADAIKIGCERRGWILKKSKKGKNKATLNLRSHQVKVFISYTNKKLEFKYISSKNMRFNGENIHKRYYTWIKKLYASINQALIRQTQ